VIWTALRRVSEIQELKGKRSESCQSPVGDQQPFADISAAFGSCRKKLLLKLRFFFFSSGLIKILTTKHYIFMKDNQEIHFSPD